MSQKEKIGCQVNGRIQMQNSKKKKINLGTFQIKGKNLKRKKKYQLIPKNQKKIYMRKEALVWKTMGLVRKNFKNI